MKKNLFIITLIFVFIVGLGLSVSAADYTLRLGHTGAPDHHYQQICELFAEKVAEKTDGGVEIKVFPKDQLGGQMESVEGVMLGTQDMVLASDTVLSNWIPDFGILNLPFLFADNNEVRTVVDGEIGDKFEAKVEPHGAVLIGWWENGMRHVTNSKRPIHSPKDLKGIKIRVPEGDVFMNTFRALGASPTVVNFGELYSALQLGTVDAQENPPAHILTQRFYEVQDYASKTAHIHMASTLLMNKALLERMPEKYSDVILSEAERLGPVHTQMVIDLEKEQWEEVIENGMEVNEVDNKEPFVEAVQPVWDQYRKELDGELLDSIIEKLDK